MLRFNQHSTSSLEPSFVIAVDFDGTCVTHEYPSIGQDCPHVVEVLTKIIAHGGALILYSIRHGDYLNQAELWFIDREIPLYGIQTNPTQASWTDSNKCYANLYIDDAALGCPLLYDASITDRPFVDWVAVDRLLQKYDWYLKPIIA